MGQSSYKTVPGHLPEASAPPRKGRAHGPRPLRPRSFREGAAPCGLSVPKAANWAGERAHRRELLRFLGGDLAVEAADAEGFRPVCRTSSEPPADGEPRRTPRGTKAVLEVEAESAAWRRIVWNRAAVREVSAEGLEEEVIFEPGVNGTPVFFAAGDSGQRAPGHVPGVGLLRVCAHLSSACQQASSVPVAPGADAKSSLFSALGLNFFALDCIESGLPPADVPRNETFKCSL